jgi:hypothetical protein
VDVRAREGETCVNPLYLELLGKDLDLVLDALRKGAVGHIFKEIVELGDNVVEEGLGPVDEVVHGVLRGSKSSEGEESIHTHTHTHTHTPHTHRGSRARVGAEADAAPKDLCADARGALPAHARVDGAPAEDAVCGAVAARAGLERGSGHADKRERQRQRQDRRPLLHGSEVFVWVCNGISRSVSSKGGLGGEVQRKNRR